jgi:oligoendopeptidase F
MFAEFELAIHEAVQKGEALTGAKLTKIYGELLRRYHGSSQGVVRVPDEYAVEWAFIPHFYYNFYVYKYATSYCAASNIVRRMLAGDPKAVQAYLKFLKGGSSKYPIELLKEAGVDMTSPEPIRDAMKLFEGLLDQTEQLLAQPGVQSQK